MSHDDDECLLIDAISKGHINTVRSILQRHTTDALVRRALRAAALFGREQTARMLIDEFGADAATDGNATLFLACQGNHVEFVRYLLQETGADPTAHRNVALRFALNAGHDVVARILWRDTRVRQTMDDETRSNPQIVEFIQQEQAVTNVLCTVYAFNNSNGPLSIVFDYL